MSRFEDFSDRDLMLLLCEAIEQQNGRYIKAIKEEINRRWREQ